MAKRYELSDASGEMIENLITQDHAVRQAGEKFPSNGAALPANSFLKKQLH
ncbi:hypothetical protein [Pseudomonas sp. R5(2019)]|uniref:hypothetical protein n=1 Tax=Pseudomonas sp. R5(2019) TaxID=2697566 RepID=UPI001412249D|nr:hypothetical protein [Pseudomonas sp. R5(2019)]NBA98234.1 hypothetical protein [Pseudomonas sp. R5(2019)]